MPDGDVADRVCLNIQKGWFYDGYVVGAADHAGEKTFADVPRLLKDKVKEILMDSGMEELVTL